MPTGHFVRCAAHLVVLVAITVFIVAQAVGQTPPSVDFVARRDFAVGQSPSGVATPAIANADLNSDGKLDLVTASNLSSDVSVLLGNGDGTFQPAVSYAVGASPMLLKIGDFNGDGKLDILVASQSGSKVAIVSVSVLLGNGDGTFQPQKVTNIANSNCLCLAVGDFNGDGKLDLAIPVSVPQLGYSAMAVMLGNGDGTFQSAITANPGPFPTPNQLEATDINGDGKPDLLAGNAGTVGPGIAVLLGNGDGTFQQPKNTPVATGVTLFAMADFNGDGKLDVVFGAASQFEVLPGNGDGTFGPPLSTTFTVPTPATFLIAADLNGDGKPDLMFSGTYFVTALLGKGDGTFHTTGLHTSIPAFDATVGDFDGDGKVDIATVWVAATVWGGYVGLASLALGNGDGTFQVSTFVSVLKQGNFQFGSSIAAGDLNGDGNTDLVEFGAGNQNGLIAVLLGNGNGTFGSPSVITSKLGYQGNSAAVGDLNRDGRLDIVATDFQTVGVFLGNGDGTFKPEVDYGGGGASVALGDFNGDGVPDIVTAGSSSSSGVSILLGNGDGTFGFPASVSTGGLSASFVAVGDFNHDGKLDMAVVLYGGGSAFSIGILLGNGDGTFGAPTDYPLPEFPIALAVGDFNGNGKLDLASVTFSGSVFVTLGNGDGTFGPVATYHVPSIAQFIAVGDLNGDGKADLAVLDYPDVSILLGNGDGTFQPAANFGSSGLASLTIADFNGDGSPDIATTGISLLFNRPKGPAVSVSPRLLSFGNQGVTVRSSLKVTLSNTSRATVTISSITIAGADSSDFGQTNTCKGNVAPGAKCTVSVTFTPRVIGSRSATLSFADNAAGSPQVIRLAGTGVSLGLAVSGSASATVAAGKTATYKLSIGGEGFAGTATLTCTGAPTGANCSLPATVNLSATTASLFMVNVTTTGRTMAAVMPNSFGHLSWMWALFLVGIAARPRSSRKRRGMAVLRCLPFFLLLFIAACGGGGSAANSGGTPAGKYTLTVQATSGSLSQPASLTLIVQ
jgi:hypothetical protein